MKNGEFITLKTLRDHFGVNPDVSEPCFYNQDWYLKEKFFKKSIATKWFLVRKNVLEESRGKNPDKIKDQYFFPSAILCAYSFFVYWYHANLYLWKHDFVWCKDIDHNGDKIYVGKYIDIDGVNKNRFSIHRHLSIRSFYGSINAIY